jgi:hypothetical protein
MAGGIPAINPTSTGRVLSRSNESGDVAFLGADCHAAADLRQLCSLSNRRTMRLPRVALAVGAPDSLDADLWRLIAP